MIFDSTSFNVLYLFTPYQKGRSSIGFAGPKSGADVCVAVGAEAGAKLSGVMPAGAAGAGRSTFHALILVNQRPWYSRLSMSKKTVSSSPGWMAACAIRSAPNIWKHTFLGYWSCVSNMYSCFFHSFPALLIPPTSGRT